VKTVVLKLAAAGVSRPGLASPFSDLAGAVAIPTAEKAASFANSRGEDLSSVGFPPQIHRRIKLVSGNPVDLEFDRGRRFGIDEAHALEVLRAHC
jgi:hypothetical protein